MALGVSARSFLLAEGWRSVNDSCPGIGRGAGVTFLHCESGPGRFLRPRVFPPPPKPPLTLPSVSWRVTPLSMSQWSLSPYYSVCHHDDHTCLVVWPLPPHYLLILFHLRPTAASLPRAFQECCSPPPYSKLHPLISW